MANFDMDIYWQELQINGFGTELSYRCIFLWLHGVLKIQKTLSRTESPVSFVYSLLFEQITGTYSVSIMMRQKPAWKFLCVYFCSLEMRVHMYFLPLEITWENVYILRQSNWHFLENMFIFNSLQLWKHHKFFPLGNIRISFKSLM